MTTLSRTLTFTVMTCVRDGCGVAYAMSDQFIAARRDDHKSFYCPNGHSQWYPDKNQTEEAQRERDLYKDRYERQINATRAARDQAEAAERQARAYKGVATKMKKRAQAGVCPVEGCKRHFADLQLHIGSKHPGYKKEN